MTAERRQLTVMFCDLVGATSLSNQLDPEDFRALLREYQSLSAAVIERFEGAVVQYLGDGILAYFGYPRAHENDVQRAVLAGLELASDAVRHLKPVGLEGGRPANLSVRIALHTGLVIAGEVGGGRWRENLAVGEAPNVAARLQALAEPNTLVISADTHHLVRHLFECQSLGIHTLRGVAQPMQVYRVIREARAFAQATAAPTGGPTPLGREREIIQLRNCWQGVRAGAGQTLLISGEAGVGKSRLVQAFLDGDQARSFARLIHHCSEQHSQSPFYPVICQIENAAGIHREDGPGARLEKLKALIKGFRPSHEELALLADLLSIPDADPFFSIAELSPQQRRQKTFTALLRMIKKLAGHAPLLVLFEDVQWADPSSRNLLETLAQHVDQLPILIIATFRSHARAPSIQLPNADCMVLNRLDDPQRLALIQQIAGAGRLTDHQLNDIAERSDGIPLFVEELTKAALESQGRAWAHPAADSDTAVPVTLNSSLLARLDRLGAGAKKVAQIGAVLGRQFSHELLLAVTGQAEAELALALTALCDATILTAHGSPPQASYSFRHALLRDAAYATLLRKRRCALHAAIANELTTRHMDMTAAQELLAHHWTQARRPLEAARAWKSAARQAVARGSFAEAQTQLHSSLALLKKLPHDRERDRQEAKLQNELGNVLIAQNGYTAPETMAAFERARQLAASIDDSGEGLRAYWGLGTALLFSGRLGAVLNMLRDAAPLVEMNGHLDAQLALSVVHGGVLFELGRLSDARAQLKATLAMDSQPGRDRQRAILYGQSPRVGALGQLSIASLLLDRPQRSQELSQQCLNEATALAHKPMLCLAYGFACKRNWLADDHSGLARHAQALQRLATDQGVPLWIALAKVFIGWGQIEDGALESGLAQMTEGVADYQACGFESETPLLLLALGRACARAGRKTRAMELLAQALGGASAGEQRWIEAEVLRERGEILAAQGDLEAAENTLQDAIATARAQDARLFEQRATASLARTRSQMAH